MWTLLGGRKSTNCGELGECGSNKLSRRQRPRSCSDDKPQHIYSTQLIFILFPVKQQQNKPLSYRLIFWLALRPAASEMADHIKPCFQNRQRKPDCLSATSFCQYSITCLPPTGDSVWPPTGRISFSAPAPRRSSHSAEQRQAVSLQQLTERQFYVSSPNGWNPREWDYHSTAHHSLVLFKWIEPLVNYHPTSDRCAP